jgi:diguanylate cyclase
MADVDNFKSFNDTWGHPLGDDVLRLIARIMRENLRQHDLGARYGGEEFALVLPSTDLRQAVVIAERLREAIIVKEVIQRSSGKTLGRVSVSIGVAQWQSGEAPRQFIERADACLYAAKEQGRNRVICEPHSISLHSLESDAD